MNIHYQAIRAIASACLLLYSVSLFAEDIDIFVGGTTENGDRPNILFVLDNTSNWARQSQQWPGGVAQGQSEVRAIQTVINSLEVNEVNVGLMMFVTDGTANDNGGYVRHHLQQLTDTSKSALNEKIDAIFNGINNPIEKRSSNEEYGYLIRDVYQYLSGGNSSHNGAGTPNSLADGAAYTANFSTFQSPLSGEDICADTHVVFIGNPNSSGPSSDDGTNSDFLRQLYADRDDEPARLASDSSGTPIGLPIYHMVPLIDDGQYVSSDGYTANCYQNRKNCLNSCNTEGYATCSCERLTSTQRAQLDELIAAEEMPSCDGGDYYWISGNLGQWEPTGGYDTSSGADWNLDDWAHFMKVHGIVMPDYTTDDGTLYTDLAVRVTTHTIDVFNRQPNVDHTSLMRSTASVGGGSYFAARSEEDIVIALNSIISDILSVNSTFASASLPISATNRSQNENQVFIGMFRPDPDAKPRWFGNLKRYQLGLFDGELDLADSQNPSVRAVNIQSGFISECATSWWTTDSDNYWNGLGVEPDPMSQCPGARHYSDLPDGPFVEKGAAAQRLRLMPDLLDRNIETLTDSNALVDFIYTATDVLPIELINFTYGQDVDNSSAPTAARPSIHGDVVHSRPLPINYGGTTGVVVYYGANDGLFRSIRSVDGQETWAYLHREHWQINDGEKLQRLLDNDPLVLYPNQTDSGANRRKDYFFDGLIGQVIDYNDDATIERAWIYPSMRRGGRMLYAFNVTNPNTPSFMWRRGCPYLDNDTDCTSGFEGIGQTWSFPNAGYIKNYGNGIQPVLIMGGGYAACEDTADTSLPTSGDCSSDLKGRGVYVIDAENGNLVRRFQTDRAIVADVSLVNIDTNESDSEIDFAYAADTDGGLYRIDFSAALPSDWTILKIAETTGGHRKFLNGPAVMAYKEHVYVALGSGNRERPLETNYPYAESVRDRFYMFLDSPKSDSDEDYPYNLDGEHMINYSDASIATCDAANVLPNSNEKGWYMDLPHRGEQTVTNALIVAGMVTFSTTRPGGASVGLCSRPIGIAEGYWLNLFNASGAIGVTGTCGGSRSSEFAGGGIPPSPVLATVPVDGEMKMVSIGAVQRDGRVGTPISPQVVEPAIGSARQRVFWSRDSDR